MKSYIVGNWKMNFTVGEASVYLHKLMQKLRTMREIEVIVAPSFVALQPLSLQLDRKKLRLAAQAGNPHDFGAYTGEVSYTQLRGIVDYGIVGHSERRQLFHETDKDIRAAVAAALRNQIAPILCIGETEAEHTFGESKSVLRDQLIGGLSEVSTEDLEKILIAYEPVWAISTTTGTHLAAPDEVSEVIQYLRRTLRETYGEVAAKIPLLYGGSVNPSNAGAYLTIPDVNGLLVGGASLVAEKFISIIDTAKKVKD